MALIFPISTKSVDFPKLFRVLSAVLKIFHKNTGRNQITLDRILHYTISDTEEGMQLLDFLRKNGFSRNILSSMKAEKTAILLNGQRGFGRSILHTGDTLRIHIPETDSSDNILPVKMDLSILFEDEDLLVVNKRADMPVHPSIGNYENTLANGITWYYQEKGEDFVFRCINRLDRDTTGALILAKNPYSAAILSAQMKQRQIRRTYLAIVTGLLPESGTIDAPIARAEDSTIERKVDLVNGEQAITHFERLAVFTDPADQQTYSLTELHLETGRTHQIRVHMKHIGHPLPGDFLYDPDYRIIRRQPLHSFQLEFTHPVTKEPMRILAPVPEDFRDAFCSRITRNV